MALHAGDGTLPFRGPDAADQRQQAQSVLVLRPERDGGVRDESRLSRRRLRQAPLFEGVLGSGVGAGLTGTRVLRGEAQAAHPLPAPLLADASPQDGCSSRRPPAGRSRSHHLARGRPRPLAAGLAGRHQQRRRARIAMAAVADGRPGPPPGSAGRFRAPSSRSSP